MLLNLIKLSYPAAYRDMDDKWKIATINMWASSFPEVPYPIIEQAFNHYRMTHKFPPTVAEMVDELQSLYYQALEQCSIQKLLENHEGVKQCMTIMSLTQQYKDTYHLGGLDMSRVQGMMGGDGNGQAYYGLHSGREGWNELRQVEGSSSPY